VDWALSVTNLEGYEYRLLQSLSGGERQRAWIAMTLAQRTNVLLLDEPTTFLDIVHQLEVMELVKRLNEEFGMTIIMVLHDINQAAQYS
ncbi:ABC transporter ATP-binding protein, partial [Acinetobacter baumannii]|nr:ABC transporter ATP-binding protein [Acinetobacter baumannii]